MLNALEKVVYPNGKTQSLAEIGGAVEGLSALIDEVDKNTSAISSINQQLGQLIGDWTLLGESEDTAINSGSFGYAQYNMEVDPFDYLNNKEVMIILKIIDKASSYQVDTFYTCNVDGTLLKNFHGDRANNVILVGECSERGGNTVGTLSYLFSEGVYIINANVSPGIYARIVNGRSSSISAKISIYTKTKPTPPTRTAKKKAVVKKKGDSK